SIAVGLALLSATITFAVLAGLTPVAPTHQVVVTVLAVDALAALLLTAVIGREIWNIMQARRRGREGARLHVRIFGLFSIVAVVGDIAPPTAAGALSAVGDEVPQVAMFLESKTVAAVIKLRGYEDTYLYVARPLDPRVIEQLQATQESVAEFANLEARRVGV